MTASEKQLAGRLALRLMGRPLVHGTPVEIYPHAEHPFTERGLIWHDPWPSVRFTVDVVRNHTIDMISFELLGLRDREEDES